MASLKQDLKKFEKIFLQAFAEEASRVFVEETKKAIDYFYKDYTPKYYNRVDNFKNNSYKPEIRIEGNKAFGGVTLSSSFMDEYRGSTFGGYGAHIDPTKPFNAAIEGIHGAYHPAHITHPSLVEHLTKITESDLLKEDIVEHALEKAASANYDWLEKR